MVRKKKYFFLILLVGLFTVYYASSSTCYALTPSNQMNAETLKNIYQYFYDNRGTFYFSNSNRLTTDLRDFINNANFEVLADDFNNRIDTSYFPFLENMCFTIISYDYNFALCVIQNNNTIGNVAPHVQITEVSTTSDIKTMTLNYYDSNGTATNGYRQNIWFTSSGSVSWTNTSVSSSQRIWNVQSYQKPITINNNIADIPQLLTLGRNGSFYIKTYQSSSYQWYWAENKIDIESSDDGSDIPVDTGNTGEITDSNGDITGQIDLTGIQNSLGNINNSINEQGQAIIDNQNENTQSIIDNQNNNTEQITDTLTDEPDLSNTVITSGDIERSFGF